MYRIRVALLQSRERAEETARDTDIRRLEPDVVVVERARAVALLPFAIGQPTDGEEIRRAERADTVVERQPDAGVELVGDVCETGCSKTAMHEF